MRVTVIFEDNMVGVDGVFHHLPVTPPDPNDRVIQWYGDNGVIEVHQGDRQWLDSIAQVQTYIDQWTQRDAELRAAVAAAEAILAAEIAADTGAAATQEAPDVIA